jgi:hypothetical protein
MKRCKFNNGQGGLVTLTDAQYRFHVEPDGSLKGVVGGYMDWRPMATVQDAEHDRRYDQSGVLLVVGRNNVYYAPYPLRHAANRPYLPS